ncbi:MAG: MFS transporter, partial [Verrucomicrobiota bacterium]
MRAFAGASEDHLGAAVAKVKQRVLPLFILMFIVNYLDRVNVGFIQQHLRTDLGLDSAA